MKKLLFGMILLHLPLLVFAQPSSFLSMEIMPGFNIPLGDSGPVFGLGGSVLLKMEYRLPFLPLLYLSGEVGYDYESSNGIPQSTSVTSASLGTGLRFDFLPWVSVTAGASGGYFYSFLNDFSIMGGNPFVSADAGLILFSGPVHLRVGASYLADFGLYSGLALSLGLSYDIASFASTTPVLQQQAPLKAQPLNQQPAKDQNAQRSAASLVLKDLSFNDVYPVFHTFYDTHPLGKVVLSNTTGQTITGIKVSFQIKEFMADPKDCPAPPQLAPGESAAVDLFGLFLPAILQTTEKTKTQARVDVEYSLGGQDQHESLVQSIPILDRNATTWEDNRRAAAFVTTKDPSVLTFSKNVSSLVKGKVQGAANPNLLTALAYFQTLQLYGLTYSQDPIPTTTENNQVADYIQFPRQTLQYKGGKCSDFSVLYSALLESVGIETAFITIPGHIFIAFSTGLNPEEARKSFSHAEDLIFRRDIPDKSWIPIEVTESAGFMQAWRDGSQEWRENLSRAQAGFYPLHDAWQLYAPVGLPGTDLIVSLPPTDKIIDAYQSEAATFINQEISSRVASYVGQIASAPDPRKPINSLGVLYAQYGLYDKAQTQFEKLLATQDYAPALLNMGNLFYLRDQKEKALDYYNRAFAVDPNNPRVLLGIAKVNHDLENYFAVRKAYTALQGLDPDLALRFSYLDLKGDEATRAADAAGVKGIVVWEE